MPIPTPTSNPAKSTADTKANGDQLLHDVSHFIGRYLQCSEHQRNLMALWCLHTHALPAARITPYLSIQSAEKQSGKSLCLQLLSLLCATPALSSGFTLSSLTRRTHSATPTVLLDECQATLGTRVRPKNPALRAILAGGYQIGPGYTDKSGERNTFSPKAFAGRGPLPEELADRSIPILLAPLDKIRGPNIERFNQHRAAQEAKFLQEQLRDWPENLVDQYDQPLQELEAKLLQEQPSDGVPEDFEAMPFCYAPEDFPPHFSPRHQDMAEPLLELADIIAGEWPERIRQALISLFEEQSVFDLRHGVQLLADIRDCFAYHGYPERLSTAVLLEWMQSLPARPWDVDGAFTARTLARLLSTFEIHPRLQRNGSTSPARGYQLQDFVEPWQTHLGFNLPAKDHDPSETTNKACPRGELASRRDAGCNAITDSRAVSADHLAGEGRSLVTDYDPSEISNAVTHPSDPRIPPQTVPGSEPDISTQQSTV